MYLCLTPLWNFFQFLAAQTVRNRRYLVVFSTHRSGLTLGNSLGAFRHKQDFHRGKHNLTVFSNIHCSQPRLLPAIIWKRRCGTICLILRFQCQKINGRMLQNLLLSTIILVGFFIAFDIGFSHPSVSEGQRMHRSGFPSQFYNIYTLKSIHKSLKNARKYLSSFMFLTFLSCSFCSLLFFWQSVSCFP